MKSGNLLKNDKGEFYRKTGMNKVAEDLDKRAAATRVTVRKLDNTNPLL
jgi:hypothetical protein